MKKFLVVLVILTVALTGVFADPGDAGNGSLTVYGMIRVGEHDFEVIELADAANNPIDLMGANVQPDGVGVKVGSWTFAAENQPLGTSFKIAYTTSPLVSESVEGVFYAFEVLEIANDNEAYANYIISFGEESTLSITQGLAVRLLEAISENAVPANDFEGSVIVTLTTLN